MLDKGGKFKYKSVGRCKMESRSSTTKALTESCSELGLAPLKFPVDVHGFSDAQR